MKSCRKNRLKTLKAEPQHGHHSGEAARRSASAEGRVARGGPRAARARGRAAERACRRPRELIFGRGKSGYKDVYPHRKGWQAKITVEDKGVCLGLAAALLAATAFGVYALGFSDVDTVKCVGLVCAFFVATA